MNNIVLEPNNQLDVETEELAANPELTAEEMADDRFAHLLLTAWTTILKEDQETDELEEVARSRGTQRGSGSTI